MVQTGKKLLSLLLTTAMVVGLVVVPAFATETTDTPDVVQGGNESTEGSGSEIPPPPTEEEKEPEEETQQPTSATPFQVGEQSYATLQAAFNAIPQGRTETIYVTSNVTVNETARCTGTRKNITITSGEGGPFTITRGEISAVQDSARSTYNPAMIEIDGNLRLENIILDDGSKTAGTRYAQATTDGSGGNNDTVQDAVIATYDGGDEIVLGNGVELRNFGGMSAVRLSGGKLTMEAGSKIVGSKNFGTNDKGATGPAGAVWMQGGELVMEEGSEITGVNGRAVYVDGGKATIDGTIRDITANSNMWQGTAGAVFHLRGGANVVMDENAKVLDCKVNKDGPIMIWAQHSDFEMQKGSEISGAQNYMVLQPYYNEGNKMLINGTIQNCTTTDSLTRPFYGTITVGPDGVIQNNTAKGAGGLLYSWNGSHYEIQGKVINNTAPKAILYLIVQSGGDCWATMSGDNAEISGNTSSYAVYINASNAKFTVSDGKISGNSGTGIYVREKGTTNGAQLVVTGGEISDKITYSSYTGSSNGLVDIISEGKITGDISISGQAASDTTGRLHFGEGVYITSAGTQFGTVGLNEDKEIYLGNAKSVASSKITELVKSYKTDSEQEENAYITRGSALWFKPTTETLHFTASRNTSINKNNYLWVAYIPLNADGTPVENADLTVKEVTNADLVDVTLEGLTPNQPYALMWMQPNDDATGMLQLTGTDIVKEEENHEGDYTVDYTVTYQPKNLSSSIAVGDTFTVAVTLDSALKYSEDSLVVSGSSYEQVGET